MKETKEQGKETSSEAISNHVIQGDKSNLTTTIPVWLFTASNPEQEILVYALLDTEKNRCTLKALYIAI